MTTTFQLLGGIGLFLMGMTLLTDGLTAFAGDSLRRALLRFTGTPFKAFASGTLVTLLLQSSAATTITLIGFVSAGLVSFPQALGVVMGASLGTTGTGWLIATLGLKVSLGLYTLPLIGIGAFLKLLGKGRWRTLGMALAGFGMLFVGIDTMQHGMRGMSTLFSLDGLGADDWTTHIVILLIGIVMTIMMQSSTAMVATTLTALNTGAIAFDQAAILVIGAAIGTTMTGVLAAIGGSILARRTVLAHVLFNLSSGIIALLLLPLLLWLIETLQHRLGLETGAIGLAAFHTLFIGIGVLLFLPHAAWFAQRIERLLPDRAPSPVSRLDSSQLQVPELAFGSTRQAMSQIATDLFLPIAAACGQTSPGIRIQALTLDRQQQLEQALNATQDFLSRIPFAEHPDPFAGQRLDQMHAIDHLFRLHARASTALPPMIANPPAVLDEAFSGLQSMLRQAVAGLSGSNPPENWLPVIKQQASHLAGLRRKARDLTVRETTSGYRTASEALQILDIMRWIERVGHHCWRICRYLQSAQADDAGNITAARDADDVRDAEDLGDTGDLGESLAMPERSAP